MPVWTTVMATIAMPDFPANWHTIIYTDITTKLYPNKATHYAAILDSHFSASDCPKYATKSSASSVTYNATVVDAESTTK